MSTTIQTMNCLEPNFVLCCLILRRMIMLVGAPEVLAVVTTTRAIHE
jgi:hypothetical protein